MRNKIDFYEAVLLVLLLIGSLTAFISALDYSPRGRLFPLIVIVILIVLLALKLSAILSPKIAARIDIQGIDFPARKSPADSPQGSGIGRADSAKWPKETMMILWLIFLLASIYLIGFLPTIPIFLFLFLKLQGKHGWPVTVVTSLAVLAFVYGLFGVVLSVQFPAGWFFPE